MELIVERSICPGLALMSLRFAVRMVEVVGRVGRMALDNLEFLRVEVG